MNINGMEDHTPITTLSSTSHQVFEVNVINNLEREPIFVQIRSDFNGSNNTTHNNSLTHYHGFNSSIIAKPINPINPIPTPMPMPIPTHTNQRFFNQQRSFSMNMNRKLETDIDKKNIKSVSKTNNIVRAGGYERNIKVYPGFVRITPLQSLPIPIVINNGKNIAFLTCYVEDFASNKVICLANQLQINRQNIEIKRSENGHHICIKPIPNQMDNLLYSWNIPQYLCNSMKNHGWDNIALWHEITELDLIEMGFQRGHRIIFFDKFTELLNLRNKKNRNDCVLLYIKYTLQSWNLPIYLHNNMISNGWVDPSDWCAITEVHFQKMGFRDGHIIKFRKHIKNNHHLLTFQDMQSEFNEEEKTEEKEEIYNTTEQLQGIYTRMQSPIPKFKIDTTTITHEQFWYKLEQFAPFERYYLEMKWGNLAWKQEEEISDTSQRNIFELDMNTIYFIRIRSENKRMNKIIYSQIAQVKTKDEQWKHTHLPAIPDYKYAVSSNNKQITVEFDPQSLAQIKQTKFDERYSLDIGLSNGVNNQKERIVNWKNVATLRKDKLVYKYNVNDQKDADCVHVGISARNDLGQRYNQCTPTRQFPFNQVIKRINTTKHGNNLQFDESMTVATKIDQDYRYSTFAFGQPVTREMCNRYDMYVKVNKLKSDCFMGFASSVESVINWNEALGYGGNKNSSVGLLANKLSTDFPVYNKDDDKRYIHHAAGGINERKWDDGSVFVISFDFLNDNCNIYLNENQDGANNDHNSCDENRLLKSVKLNQIKSVVPSFSLNSEGDSIQVVKWRLY